MKLRHFFLFGCAALISSPWLGAAEWVSNFDEALKKAEESNKDLFISFIGGEWSPWSQRLKAEIFQHEKFLQEADQAFVLFQLELPQNQEEEVYRGLPARYQVQGFPTIVLADSKGRPYRVTGYLEGGYDHFMQRLHESRLQGQAVREDLKKAQETANHGERAKVLEQGLGQLSGVSISDFYPEELAQLKEIAPESPLLKTLAHRARLLELGEHFGSLFQEGNYEAVVKESAKLAQEAEGAQKQQILLYAFYGHLGATNYEAAGKVLDEIVEVSGETELARRIPEFREILSKTSSQAEVRRELLAKRVATQGENVAQPNLGAKVAELRGQLEVDQQKLAGLKEQGETLKAGQEEEAKKIAQIQTKVTEELKRAQEAVKKAEAQVQMAQQRGETSATKWQEKVEQNAKAQEEVATIVKNREEELNVEVEKETKRRKITELERVAADLQKQAEDLRREANELKKD